MHVVSCGTDKKIIVSEIIEEEIEGNTKFKSKCIYKMESKNYYDIAMASNILVCSGK